MSEALQKKYSVSDAATLAIIETCNKGAGLQMSAQPAPSEAGAKGTPSPESNAGLAWEDMKGRFDPTDAVFVGSAAGGDVYVCRADFSSEGDGWHAGKTFAAAWPNCSGEWGNKTFLKPGQILRALGAKVDWAPVGEIPTSGVRVGTDGVGNAVFVCRGKPANGRDGWHAGKAWRGNGSNCSMEWDNRTANPPGQDSWACNNHWSHRLVR